jgi:hypothetical protein
MTTCPNCHRTNVEHNTVQKTAHKAGHAGHLGGHLLHNPLLGLAVMAAAAVASMLAGPAHTCRDCKHKF